MSDEKAESAAALLEAALAYYKGLGVMVSRVMTDNGPCYKSFAKPTKLQMTAMTNCRDGSIATTGIGPMVASGRRHLSADSD